MTIRKKSDTQDGTKIGTQDETQNEMTSGTKGETQDETHGRNDI